MRSQDRDSARRYSSHNLRLAEITRLLQRRSNGNLPSANLQGHIRKVLGDDLGKYSPRELGRLLQLTYEERKALRIKTIQCFDKTTYEIAQLRLEDKRQRARERRTKGKAAKTARSPIGDLFNDGNLPERSQAVFDLVHARRWMTSAEIEAKARTLEIFQPLTSDTLHRAVHRGLQDLQRRGLLERRMISTSKLQYRRSRLEAGSIQLRAVGDRQTNDIRPGA